jgi:hypothetical protein
MFSIPEGVCADEKLVEFDGVYRAVRAYFSWGKDVDMERRQERCGVVNLKID